MLSDWKYSADKADSGEWEQPTLFLRLNEESALVSGHANRKSEIVTNRDVSSRCAREQMIHSRIIDCGTFTRQTGYESIVPAWAQFCGRDYRIYIMQKPSRNG